MQADRGRCDDQQPCRDTRPLCCAKTPSKSCQADDCNNQSHNDSPSYARLRLVQGVTCQKGDPNPDQANRCTESPLGVRGNDARREVEDIKEDSREQAQRYQSREPDLHDPQCTLPINRVGHCSRGNEPPNGARLSCGALKRESFLNLRAPSASSAG